MGTKSKISRKRKEGAKADARAFLREELERRMQMADDDGQGPQAQFSLDIHNVPWGQFPTSVAVIGFNINAETPKGPRSLPIVQLAFVFPDGRAFGVPMPADLAVQIADGMLKRAAEIKTGLTIPEVVVPMPRNLREDKPGQ